MNSFILYLLESGLCLLVFFSLYQLFLKRETYYQLNRVYLLTSLVFSLVVPLLNITLRSQSTSQIASFHMEPILVSATTGAVATTKQIGIFEVLAGIYFLVVLVLTVRLLLNFKRITKLYSIGRVNAYKNYKLILHSMNYPPFSFFNNIFISEKHYTGEQLDDIIEHEKAHVRQMHSVDLVIAEVLKILQWFNPMAWYFKNMVTENHEFLADEAVINRGFSPESYQLRILTQLFGIRSMPAVHNFNQSVTQKRLKMMEKSKSTAASKLKMLSALPAAILLFYMFGCTSGSTDLSAQDEPEVSGKMEVYYEVDEMAQPDGGVMAFRKDLATHIKYPEEAAKNGVQGKIFVRFIVDERGKLIKAVEDSRITSDVMKSEGDSLPALPEKVEMEGIVVVGYRPIKGDDSEYSKEHIQLLADEAVRVIMDSEVEWKPAMKDGKAVKSAWTIPIAFALQ
ncbi:M56 family metallopeptidase [Bacteroidota bacterium]